MGVVSYDMMLWMQFDLDIADVICALAGLLFMLASIVAELREIPRKSVSEFWATAYVIAVVVLLGRHEERLPDMASAVVEQLIGWGLGPVGATLAIVAIVSALVFSPLALAWAIRIARRRPASVRGLREAGGAG